MRQNLELSEAPKCDEIQVLGIHSIKENRDKLSRDVRKSGFVISDQVRLKPFCTVTEAGQKLEISDLRSREILLSVQRKTKALNSFVFTANLICAFVSPRHFAGFLMQWLNYQFRLCKNMHGSHHCSAKTTFGFFITEKNNVYSCTPLIEVRGICFHNNALLCCYLSYFYSFLSRIRKEVLN